MLLLPSEIINKINFNELFNLKPDKNSKIILFDKSKKEFKEREIFRSYMSYLNTPHFDDKVKKSYMFLNKSDVYPEQLQQFLDFAKSIDARYNQMVVNWYNPDDYIEQHRDCTSKMINKDCDILMINLNESDDLYKIRNLNFIDVENNNISSIPLLNNTYHIIKNNNTHRHFVGKGVEKRISITFRMMK